MNEYYKYMNIIYYIGLEYYIIRILFEYYYWILLWIL